MTVAAGDLFDQFKSSTAQLIGPLGFSAHIGVEAQRLAGELAATYQPRFAVALGADIRYLAAPLAQAGVPIVAVINEYAANVVPRGSLLELFFWAADLVFPAAVIRDSYLADYTMLGAKRTHLLPVGPMEVLPAGKATGDTVTVVGYGPVEWRQGVDLFVGVAQACRARLPECNCASSGREPAMCWGTATTCRLTCTNRSSAVACRMSW